MEPTHARDSPVAMDVFESLRERTQVAYSHSGASHVIFRPFPWLYARGDSLRVIGKPVELLYRRASRSTVFHIQPQLSFNLTTPQCDCSNSNATFHFKSQLKQVIFRFCVTFQCGVCVGSKIIAKFCFKVWGQERAVRCQCKVIVRICDKKVHFCVCSVHVSGSD